LVGTIDHVQNQRARTNSIEVLKKEKNTKEINFGFFSFSNYVLLRSIKNPFGSLKTDEYHQAFSFT